MKSKTTKKCAALKTVAKNETKKCDAKKCDAKEPAKKAVTFTVHAEKGKAVYLAGCFNDWNPTGKKMTFKAGVYSATVKLAPGEYQYKFIIDGEWQLDRLNPVAVYNEFGSQNNVLVVS